MRREELPDGRTGLIGGEWDGEGVGRGRAGSLGGPLIVGIMVCSRPPQSWVTELETAETFSNEPDRLSTSPPSLSVTLVKVETELGVPPPSEREIEWNEEMEEAGACPIPGRGFDVSRDKNGGYVCSTVSESERLGGAGVSEL